MLLLLKKENIQTLHLHNQKKRKKNQFFSNLLLVRNYNLRKNLL